MVLILPDSRQPCFSFKQRAPQRANLFLYKFISGSNDPGFQSWLASIEAVSTSTADANF
jgi:hypothetical protein